MVKYLGIDWGTARIGLSTGDSDSRLALPYKAVPDFGGVEAAVKSEAIDEIVVGEPKTLAGGANSGSRHAAFVSRLQSAFKLPVHIVDERLSSLEADRLTARSKAGAGRDSVAAMLILQSYFDQNPDG